MTEEAAKQAMMLPDNADVITGDNKTKTWKHTTKDETTLAVDKLKPTDVLNAEFYLYNNYLCYLFL